ncbi:MAG: efflux transporter outer membrane subunit [Paucibacter sp.]|nr:efflux transporter outer membrane subunit [Roseateles sp.]
MNKKLARLSALGLAVMLAACAPIPKLAEPAKPLDTQQLGLADKPQLDISARWWSSYQDAALDALIDRALAQNPNLAAASARVAHAQAMAEAAGAQDRPVIGAGADWTRQHLSENGFYPKPFAGETLNVMNLGVGVSYNWDFFGRHKAEIESALGARRAAEMDAAAARLMLSAQVTRAYFGLARVLAQQTLLNDQLADRQQSLDLVRERQQAGLDNTQDLRQAETPLTELRRQSQALDEQASLLRNQLAALSVQPAAELASLSPRMPALLSFEGQPTLNLLGRRPDVLAARSRVESATGQVTAAKAQFYPDVTLAAQYAFNATTVSKLLQSSSGQWNFGPALRVPLFDTGALRAQLKGRAAELDSAVAAYNGTVLEAVRDASDQVASLQSLQAQEHQTADGLASTEAAYVLARERFDAGMGNKLVVLAAHGQVLAQQRSLLDLRAQALDTQVNLLRALGGGIAN